MAEHVVMPCGWGCGLLLTARIARSHFSTCPNRPRKTGFPAWLYIAESRSGEVLKVGITTHRNLAAKLSSLRKQGMIALGITQEQSQWKFLAVWRSTSDHERPLLLRFRRFLVAGGEWFRSNQEMLEFAAQIGVRADEASGVNEKGQPLTQREYGECMRRRGQSAEWGFGPNGQQIAYTADRFATPWGESDPPAERVLIPIEEM